MAMRPPPSSQLTRRQEEQGSAMAIAGTWKVHTQAGFAKTPEQILKDRRGSARIVMGVTPHARFPSLKRASRKMQPAMHASARAARCSRSGTRRTCSRRSRFRSSTQPRASAKWGREVGSNCLRARASGAALLHNPFVANVNRVAFIHDEVERNQVMDRPATLGAELQGITM